MGILKYVLHLKHSHFLDHKCYIYEMCKNTIIYFMLGDINVYAIVVWQIKINASVAKMIYSFIYVIYKNLLT